MYISHNHCKYSLQVHLIFVTKYRKQLFCNSIDHDIKLLLSEAASRLKITIIIMESDKDHIHLMIKYHPTMSVSDIAKHLKQYTTHHIWRLHENYLRKHYYRRRIFWSDGYFACSTGEASTETIYKYIESQG